MGMNFDGYLLSGDDYKINDYIIIHQPTLKQILEYDEKKYWNLISIITSSPADLKSQLFDTLGLNFDQVDDFYVFSLLASNLTKDDTYIILGDSLNFPDYTFGYKDNNLETLSVHKEDTIIMDRFVYEVFVEYLRQMHGFKRNCEKAGNDYTRKFLIDEAREQLKNSKSDKFKSVLKPYISLVCSMTLYKRTDVLDMPIFIFIDMMLQLLHNKTVDHLYAGIYSGTVDPKKVNSKNLSYIREL